MNNEFSTMSEQVTSSLQVETKNCTGESSANDDPDSAGSPNRLVSVVERLQRIIDQPHTENGQDSTTSLVTESTSTNISNQGSQNFIQSTEYVLRGNLAMSDSKPKHVLLHPDVQLVVTQELTQTNKGDTEAPVVLVSDPQMSMSIVNSTTMSQDSDMDSKELRKEKPFKCTLCNARFTSKGNLSRHGLIHTVQVQANKDRFTCPECDKDFLQQCDLVRHKQIHSQSEPHRCHICDNAYLRRSDLSAHIRFHKKEKVFKCDHCTMAFCQSGDLNRHVRTVHLKVKKLGCSLCSRKYVTEKTLLRHMQTAHREAIVNSWSSSKANDTSDKVMPS